eukprot:TRINITY_DN1743_c0_g2_i6.p1 TRINITY_DN1743_c0_g2~~TRINITY_DN1743_c0_g2_i6.p1  ORF type:complete len:432 (-),score=73.46 TRINITY_DN1743_c0_g2_i6:271-1566(-)
MESQSHEDIGRRVSDPENINELLTPESTSDCSSASSSNPSSNMEVCKEKERARANQTSLMLWHARQNEYETVERLIQEDPTLVNAQDYDSRTPLHAAALHGSLETAECLIHHGANVNAQDRWKNSGNHGSRVDAKQVAPPMPQKCDWEIDPSELDFTSCVHIGKGSFGEILKAKWRGTPVAVKRILPSLSDDRLVIQDFRNEVELLVKLRHPNIVQFLGAVTKRAPLMLITEFLKGGDLHQYLKDKGALHPATATNFALDMARGMAYLHNGPNVIIHRDLKPRNVLMVSSNHLKVGDFGLSKLIKVKHAHDMYRLTGETGSYRYMAPEVFEHRHYDAKVDVFSYAMILYQMYEGSPPFANYEPYDAARLVAKRERPIFHAKTYPSGMKELIEQCWDHDVNKRPTFLEILERLEKMKVTVSHEHHWGFLHHN